MESDEAGVVQVVIPHPQKYDGLWHPTWWIADLMCQIANLRERVEALEAVRERETGDHR